MEEAAVDVPVWVILSVLAAISAVTLCITVLDYIMRRKDRSLRILSDMLKSTKEFRYGLDRLWKDLDLDEKARDDLVRVLTYMEVLALCKQDGLIKDDYVKMVYSGLFQALTDEKIVEILQDDLPGIRVEHLQDPKAKLYHRLRAVRDDWLGSDDL